MNVDGLVKVRTEIEVKYNQLASAAWVAGELSRLKGQYEVLSEIIEGEQNATNQTQNPTGSDGDHNQRKQAVSRKIKG